MRCEQAPPLGQRLRSSLESAGTTVSVPADKSAYFSSLTGPWPQGIDIPDDVALLVRTGRCSLPPPRRSSPLRLTTRDGPVFYYPGLTARSYINVRGQGRRVSGSAAGSDSFPAFPVVACWAVFPEIPSIISRIAVRSACVPTATTTQVLPPIAIKAISPARSDSRTGAVLIRMRCQPERILRVR